MCHTLSGLSSLSGKLAIKNEIHVAFNLEYPRTGHYQF